MYQPRYGPKQEILPNTPRKKGFARLVELIGRDFVSYWCAGMLAVICFVPTFICAYLALSSNAWVFVLAGGLLGAIGGPALTALYDTILRTMRDEPGYWWHTYKKAFSHNAKASLLPGVIYSLLICAELLCIWQQLLAEEVDIRFALFLVIGAFLLIALGNLYWVQLALFKMPHHSMLYNAVMLFLGCLPQVSAGSLLQLLYWIAMFAFWPESLTVFLCTGIWLPILTATCLIYPTLDSGFQLETRIEDLKQSNADE